MRPPTQFAITPRNLDSALRYERAISLISDVYRPDLSILEIGSGSAGITEFLKHPATGLDAEFERTVERESSLLHRVSGTAASLPFPDASYDVVISLDMLEHIPPVERADCLREMLRILRPGGRCILAFPADQSGERLDRRLNEAFRKRHKIDHPWVIEHIERGLPRTDDVVALLKRVGGPRVRVTVHKHLWGVAWFHAVHRFFTVGTDNRLILKSGLLSRRGATLVFNLVKRMNFRPAYRTILVIDRDR